MASPKASGRMIRKTISDSEKIASLSPMAAVLFMMLIPHFNAHGKMSGGPGVVKDEVVPLIPYLTYDNIPEYLSEISERTNVKWFRYGNKWWIHSLHFNSEHQELRADKMGVDDLPSYSCTESDSSTGVVPDSPSREEGFKVLREEEKTKKPTATRARIREIIVSVMNEHRDVLIERFPQCEDLNLVVEKLVAYQATRGIPVDPWLLMLQWFQKEWPDKKGRARADPKTFEQIKRENTAKAAQEFCDDSTGQNEFLGHHEGVCISIPNGGGQIYDGSFFRPPE